MGMTDFEILAYTVVANIDYKKDYDLLCQKDKKDPQGRLYYQVRCWRPDTNTNIMDYGYGGKAYLSEHMTFSELVRRAYSLFASFEEHECREAFRYDGVRVFGPHISVEALMSVADQLDARPAPENS